MAFIANEQWTNRRPPGFTAQEMIRIQTGLEDADTIARGAAVKGDVMVSARDYGAVGDGQTDDRAAIQAAIDAASARGGAALIPAGTYVVSGAVNLGDGANLVAQDATLVQSEPLTSTVMVDGEDVTISNLRIEGVTDDFENTSTVYRASAITVNSTARNVHIFGSSLLGMAGAGVMIHDGADEVNILNCTITGAGPAYIAPEIGQFSAGIRSLQKSGSWSAQFNDVSGFAQGMITSDYQSNYRIIGNRVHDIPGQHGLYLQSVAGGVVQGNTVWNTVLNGMKIQLLAEESPDTEDVTINNNVFINNGAHAILLTAPQGGTPRLRRIIVSGNVISGSGWEGISANNCVGLLVTGNLVYSARSGIRLEECTGAEAIGNQVSNVRNDGIYVEASADVTLQNNRARNPGGDGISGRANGIHIQDSCSNVTATGNKMTGDAGTMQYGIYLRGTTPDLTSMDFIGNIVLDATEYGWRFNGDAQSARQFHGNYFEGGSGSMLVPPTNFVQSPDTNGATLGGLEAEVNALKAALRASGIIRG